MPRSKVNKIEIITHYTKSNLDGDYSDVEVLLNGEQIGNWGDSYHDKGTEKAEGFVAGLIWGKMWKDSEYKVIEKQIDDRNEYGE
jgi:hypothetical protein